MRLMAPVPSAWTNPGALRTTAPISATAECFTYEAIRLESISISLHRVTTAFKTSGQRTAVAAGLLIEFRHPGGVPRVVALLGRLRLRLALALGYRTGGATQNRTTHCARARIASDDGADDRSS